MSDGSRLAAHRRRALNRRGESLTITNILTGTARTAQGIAYPLDENGVGQFFPEAGQNANEDNPHMFVFSGDTVVDEANDRITYDGIIFRVSKVNHRRVSGVNLSVNCLGVREGIA